MTRIVNGQREYLIVEDSKGRGEWVLPKGHIEEGETAEAAAIREVEEEAGVRAVIVEPAGDGKYSIKGKLVRTIYFLMLYQEEIGRAEERTLQWHRFETALELLSFEDTRRVLARAHAMSAQQ